jgi:hypothetical protein
VQQLPGYVRAYPGKCAPLSPPGKRNLSLCTLIRASRYQSERPYHRYEWDDTAAVTMSSHCGRQSSGEIGGRIDERRGCGAKITP